MFRPAALLLLMLGISATCVAETETEPMNCDVGPIERSFGANEWIVYSCQDQQSIVVVSAPGSPAMPFYFMITPIDGKYQLHGEGNGDKTATNAAYQDLKLLDEAAIAELISATNQQAAAADPN